MHVTAWDVAVEEMRDRGFTKDRAEELLTRVLEEAKEQGSRNPPPPEPEGGCVACGQQPLNHLLGHDLQGHKLANSLTRYGVTTREGLVDLMSGDEWMSRSLHIGDFALRRIRTALSESGE